MSEILEALLLGIVQGLTEFLPVSSSGHLEILKFLLNDDALAKQSLMTSVVLHFATALATVVVFRKDIIVIIKGLFAWGSQEQKFALFIVISMIPAVIAGFLLEDIIDSLFHQAIVFVAFMLLLTGIILLLSEKITTRENEMTAGRSFIIGLAQACALLPGLSRSGSTIGTALLLGIDKQEAARFSFLMVIPLIFGKMAKDILSGAFVSHMPSMDYLVTGFIAAFITGCFACIWMIKIVRKAKLSYFAYYCFLVFASIIIYSFFFQ